MYENKKSFIVGTILIIVGLLPMIINSIPLFSVSPDLNETTLYPETLSSYLTEDRGYIVDLLENTYSKDELANSYVKIYTSNVNNRNEFALAITVDETPGVLGLAIELRWFAECIEYINHTLTMPYEDFPISQSPSPYPGYLWDPIFLVKNEVTWGKIHIAVSEMNSVGGLLPYKGAGTVAVIYFKLKSGSLEDKPWALTLVQLAGENPISIENNQGQYHYLYSEKDFPLSSYYDFYFDTENRTILSASLELKARHTNSSATVKVKLGKGDQETDWLTMDYINTEKTYVFQVTGDRLIVFYTGKISVQFVCDEYPVAVYVDYLALTITYQGLPTEYFVLLSHNVPQTVAFNLDNNYDIFVKNGETKNVSFSDGLTHVFTVPRTTVNYWILINTSNSLTVTPEDTGKHFVFMYQSPAYNVTASFVFSQTLQEKNYFAPGEFKVYKNFSLNVDTDLQDFTVSFAFLNNTKDYITYCAYFDNIRNKGYFIINGSSLQEKTYSFLLVIEYRGVFVNQTDFYICIRKEMPIQEQLTNYYMNYSWLLSLVGIACILYSRRK